MSRLPSFLTKNKNILNFYKSVLDKFLENVDNLEEKSSSPFQVYFKDQLILTLKILIIFVTYTTEHLDLVFSLVDIVNLKSCYDLGFVSSCYKHVIPKSYNEETKKRIFLQYLDLYFSTDTMKSSTIYSNEQYLKQVNYILILPILYELFQKNDVQHSFLFNKEVQERILAVIAHLSKEDVSYLSWILIEFTILMDYIISKMDSVYLKEGPWYDLLSEIIIFSWRNIVKQYDNSKLLLNLSKLLVSRIQRKSNILRDKLENFFELFNSVVQTADDIVDDETKNIWLNTCDLILPEIEANNMSFANNVNGSPSFWLEEFLKCIGDSSVGNSLTISKDVNFIYSRGCNVIIKNRNLIKPFKYQLLEKDNRFYSILNHFMQNIKTPYILLDVLLLFIIWYIEDYKKFKAEGKPTDKINGLTTQKEDFLIQILLNMVKRDSENCGFFLHRSFYLFRLYYLLFRKSKIIPERDLNQLLMSANQKKSISPMKEDSAKIRKKLKMNFVVMNICLAILYNFKLKEGSSVGDIQQRQKEIEMLKNIYDYVLRELPHRHSKDYINFPHLIPLGYHIIRKILKICEKEKLESKLDEYFDDICTKAGESVKMIVSSEKDKKNQYNNDSPSLWIAILLFRLVYEMRREKLGDQIENFHKLNKLLSEYLTKKKSKELPSSTNPVEEKVQFDENEDILDKLFACSNTENHDSKLTPRGYFKGYMILIMRILVKYIEKTIAISQKVAEQTPGGADGGAIFNLFSDLLKNLNHSDYDAKIEILMLIRCLLIPQSIKSPVYKGLATNFLKLAHRIHLLNILKPEFFLKTKDNIGPAQKLFMKYYWNFIIDFIDAYPNTRGIIEFIRKISLIENNQAFTLEQKDVILNKMRQYSGDDHFSKFYIIPNLEIFNSHIYQKGEPEDIIDSIKKYNLITGAYFAQQGVIKSKMFESVDFILNNVFEEEANRIDEEEIETIAFSKKEEEKKEGAANKSPDVYKLDRIDDIVCYFDKNSKKFRKTLEKKSVSLKFFNSYRNIIDMENFSEKNNTLIFWKDYIKQLWDEASVSEREKIWMMLNDLLNYSFNSQNDTLFLLLTMKELTVPFMLPEQLKMMTKKIAMYYPLAPIYFLEGYLDKSIEKNTNISPDSIYYCFSEALEDLCEKDLLLGYRKTKLEEEEEKNMLTMLQLRDYQSAEELCEELSKKSEIIIPSRETLKGYIEKHIYEESWIEIQKNCNEWNVLYEMARETERKDLLFESAYFTERNDTVINLFSSAFEEEAINYVYFISSKLMNERDRNELIEPKAIKFLKEPIYLMLIKGWYFVPEVFSQMHINHLGVSHFCIEFEEAFDIIQDNYQIKKVVEPKQIVKLKDDITYHNLICRQRRPNSSEGIVNCKRIFQQRSIISNILYQRIDNLMDQRSGVNLSSNVSEERGGLHIFNETNHNAIMYCSVERHYEMFSSLINLKKDMDRLIEDKLIATQTDEYYYYKEILHMWELDEDASDPPQSLLNRLDQDNFNKDFKSDLHGVIMNGYLSKNQLDLANRHGIAGLKLNEENWKIWKVWFQLYKKLYHTFLNNEKNLQYFNQMLKSYVKAIKYKPYKTLLLFSDILTILYFRDDLVKSKYNSDEASKTEILQSFKVMLHDTPIWTWCLWLGNLLVSVYKKNTLKLDNDFIMEAVAIASKSYNAYVYFVLNGILNAANMKDETIEEAFNKCKNNPLVTIKSQENNISKLFDLFTTNLDTLNEHQETISLLYSQEQIDSRKINEINAKLKDIGDGYNQFKNQDSSQKLLSIIKSLDDYLSDQKTKIQKKPNSGLNSLPLGLKFTIPNSSHYYSEKNISEFFLEGSLLPDIKIVYEARRFKLLVEFFSNRYKKMTFTVEKNNLDSINLMNYNHFLKLLNIEMLKHNETIYRGVKFEMMDMIYLEEDFCLKSKAVSEIYTVDLLDWEMENMGERVDHALELFAMKKNTNEVNKSMIELVSKSILVKETTRRLNNQFDLFLWKKKYAYSLGVNMINSLIFFKEHNFEKLRIVVKTAEFYDDNMNFKIDIHQKTKTQSRLPLRLTQNNRELLHDYIIEGALYPAIGAVGKALYGGTGDISYSSILSLFVKDFFYNSTEERGLVYKFIEQNMENHYNSLLKMAITHESVTGKNTRNPTFTSIRAFIENISNEDTIKTFPLSFRSWF